MTGDELSTRENLLDGQGHSNIVVRRRGPLILSLSMDERTVGRESFRQQQMP